ncbi:MAG TPA: hypothetical protein VG122_24055 [Gemmata sp.]|jgi:hypothetical protein|nr:hypothetical protein [Gemmata sp.]
MSNNRTVARARFTARLFGRGVFVGLLGLALTITIMSFLTACICFPNSSIRQDEIMTTAPGDHTIGSPPSNLPVIPPSSDKKDN